MSDEFKSMHATTRLRFHVSRPSFFPLGVLLLGAAMFGPAQAGRPLTTEDAPVQAQGECQVDSFWGRLISQTDGATRTLSTQLTCGVGLRTQLALGYSDSRPEREGTRSVLVAGKTSLTEPREDSAGLSIAYGAPAERTAGSPTRMGDAFVTLACTLPLTAKLLTHANLGWTGSHDNRSNTTRWALALESAVRDNLSLVAETFADDHDRKPWLVAGLSQKLGENISINASYGGQTRGAGRRTSTLGFIVGF